MDFAKRAYDHTYKMDPIYRSHMDTDFYKFPMQQFIFEDPDYSKIDVEFAVTNRTKGVRLADIIDETELREQLDYARTVKFRASELAYLRGQKFYAQSDIFTPNYLKFLETYQLPEYELIKTDDGQYDLRSADKWSRSTMWEMPFLTILNEMKTRAQLKQISRFEMVELYAKAQVRLFDKLRFIAGETGQDLNFTDFGTRRRHSHLWQEFCIEAAQEHLGKRFTGTSNVFFAMNHDLEARGTNAHELQMATMAGATFKDMQETKGNPEFEFDGQYDVLDRWQERYHSSLWMMLPDTYGTTQFLKNAPAWLVEWTGARPDSKEPVKAAQELIRWWEQQGQNPKNKLILFSDGLNEQLIVKLYKQFNDQVRLGFGMGTNLTNDFGGIFSHDLFKPISVVAKVAKADGQPAVKLSDNYTKATGLPEIVDEYRKVFGVDGLDNLPVTV